MVETIVESFSNKSWLLIKSEHLQKFIQHFNFQRLQQDAVWLNSDFYTQPAFTSLDQYTARQTERILVSSPVQGFCFVEGQIIDRLHDPYSIFLSTFADTYYFQIDIWIPIFRFALYRHSKRVRDYTYTIVNGEESTQEYGAELDVEKTDMDIIPSQYGYDYFFYPLSIINHLGISNEDIYHVLHQPCTLYKVNQHVG